MTQPRYSAIGSMPGTDARETARMVRDLFGDNAIPFLAELPARGPGADMIGRSAAHLVGLGLDLQPSGWRLADAAGLDARRGQAFLREDLDELAEAFAGYSGQLKVQWCGPWTMAGSLWLPRGERVLSDAGAARDLIQSVAESVREHLRKVRTLVPDAHLVLQWDEPSLPALLAGSLPTASGFGRLRPVDQATVIDGLQQVVSAATEADTQTLHCCAPNVPIPLIRRVTGLDLAIDTSLVGTRQWDGIAELVESGRTFWAGSLPTDGSVRHPAQVAEPLLRSWREIGLLGRDLQRVVLTPACGLAGAAPSAVPGIVRTLAQAAELLGEASEGLSAG